MPLLEIDNFNNEKFLLNISSLIDQYHIGEQLSPLGKLVQFLGTSEYFNKEIFEIYTEYYKRQFITLELLANKQGLDTKRKVFNLVRNHISRKNIKLNLTNIVNLYLSYIRRRIIITPEVEEPSGLYFINPK